MPIPAVLLYMFPSWIWSPCFWKNPGLCTLIDLAIRHYLWLQTTENSIYRDLKNLSLSLSPQLGKTSGQGITEGKHNEGLWNHIQMQIWCQNSYNSFNSHYLHICKSLISFRPLSSSLCWIRNSIASHLCERSKHGFRIPY